MHRNYAISVVAMFSLVFAAADGFCQGRRTGDLRIPDKLKQGDLAPDFTLKSPDGKAEVTLSQFRGQKPVALVFGSYT